MKPPLLVRRLVATLSILLFACASEEPPGAARQVTPTVPWSQIQQQPPGSSTELNLTASTIEAFWRARTGDEVWSSPAVGDGGLIVFGSDDRHIYGLDSRDGAERWKTRVDGPVRKPPVPAGDRVLVVDEDGSIYALGIKDGDLRWRHRLSEASTRAWAAVGEHLVHGGPGSPVTLRSSADGNILWQRRLGDPEPGLRALSLDQQRIYGITDSGRVAALSKSGESLWAAELKVDTRSPATPFNDHLLLVGNGFLWCLDARTGHEHWRALTDEFVSASPEIAPRSNSATVLVAGGDTLFAFDLELGHELWRRHLEGAFRSGPRALDTLVLVGSGEHLLTAFALHTGHERWRFETDAFITGALSTYGHPIHGNRVLFGGVDGGLYGVSMTPAPAPDPTTDSPEPVIRVGPSFFDGTPTIRWRRQVSSGSTEPLVHADRVFQLSADHLSCLGLSDGKPCWTYRLKHRASLPVAPTISSPHRLVIVADDGRLLALSTADGTEQWATRRAALQPRVLTITQDLLLVGTAEGRALALDPDTGDRLWARALDAPITAKPSAGAGAVFFATATGKLVALDAHTGRELWSASTPGSLVSEALFDSDTLYIGDTSGTVYGFDPVVGGQRWTSSVGGSIRLSPTALFGTIFWCGDDGRLFAVDALTGAESWRLSLGRRCTAAPLAHDGIVYAGSQERSLHATNAVNGEELWRLHMTAPVVGSAVGTAADGRATLVVTDRSGLVLAVDLP